MIVKDKSQRNYRMTCDIDSCGFAMFAPLFRSEAATIEERRRERREHRLNFFATHFLTTRCSGYHICKACVNRILEADLSGERCKLRVAGIEVQDA